MPNALIVDARGRKGGLGLLWPRDLNVEIKSFSTHHIEACIKDGAAEPWRTSFGELYPSESLDLMGWKRTKLGHVQNSIKEKQVRLDALKQNLITISSKGEATVLARDIDKLREADDIYWCQRSKLHTSQFEPQIAQLLDRKFVKEEVKKCLFTMAGSKSAGPDGMPATFFQHYWTTVGDTLCNMVLSFLNDGRFLKKFNFTFITLIPKVEKPITMSQFRPIALCNTTAKVIDKVLAMRLKKFLPNVISDSQSAFVPNRLITDNILLAYEEHHLIKQRKHGNQGLMYIKLDMLKAYDHIEWPFLRAILYQLGFSNKWVHLIMQYVESVTYSLLING
ncbi:hypothetical protein LIER_12839 [Lithospermum erythrorhizon]|uniref:Reverse transcriptase domain-containing protein n=1 Tax=Lithospermum erythrorhizon TaxID=34254 RepID=A0AAV3PVQ1_LITER